MSGTVECANMLGKVCLYSLAKTIVCVAKIRV